MLISIIYQVNLPPASKTLIICRGKGLKQFLIMTGII